MSLRGRPAHPARTGAMALLVAAPLVLAACSSGSSGGTAAANSHSPIIIGYEVPLTGTAALPGKQEQEGWNLGLKVFGSIVDGHKIITYFDDTGGTPTVALSDAQGRERARHDGGRADQDLHRGPAVGHAAL